MRLFTFTVLIFAFPFMAMATPDRRVGPADEPFLHPDFGGTPDVTILESMGINDQELEQLLAKLTSSDVNQRAKAAIEIVQSSAGAEQTYRQALWGQHGAKNTEMKSAVRRARNNSEDVLQGLISIEPSDSQDGQGAVGALRIFSMLRALDRLNTMAAYKVMIEFSPRHAGLFRSDVGKLLVNHGLEAMPALVYGRGSKNKELHMFCVKWIRDMGNPLLSEQVKIKNPRRLAQLVESYASVNELDAIDVTLSFTNHESSYVRMAARASLASYDKNAKWPTRRLYENTFGQEPGDESTESILKKLYTHFDKKRKAATLGLLKKGQKAQQENRFVEMSKAYRELLRQAPLFENRGSMAQGFLQWAAVLEKEDELKLAIKQYKMASRLVDPGSPVASQVEAKLKWLQAEQLRKRAIVDSGLYESVLAQNPDNKVAQSLLSTIKGDAPTIWQLFFKTLIVSMIVFCAALLVYLRIRTRKTD